MHPAPTEHDRRQVRQRRTHRSVAYLVAFCLWLFFDRISRDAIHHARAWTVWLPTALAAGAALAYGLWRGERDLMKAEDELAQKIRTESLAAAFPLAIGVALILSKLEQAHIDLIDPSMQWVVLLLPYGIVQFFIRRRYGVTTPMQ